MDGMYKSENTMETKTQLSRYLFEAVDRVWWYNQLKHTTTEKYENNGNCWYFWYDGDNRVS